MTQDEIMELVRQAGGTFGSHIAWVERDLMPVYIRFAHLVAEKEREACAKVCDEFFKGNKSINYSDTIAICIRARDYQKGKTD